MIPFKIGDIVEFTHHSKNKGKYAYVVEIPNPFVVKLASLSGAAILTTTGEQVRTAIVDIENQHLIKRISHTKGQNGPEIESDLPNNVVDIRSFK